MDERLGVLQRVVDTLDEIAFAQHYLVPQRHEPVLYVGLYAGDEVYAVGEEVVEPKSVIRPTFISFSFIKVCLCHGISRP